MVSLMLQSRKRVEVEQHTLAYEATGNHFLTTKALLWRYPILREQYTRAQRQLRKDLDNWLCEHQGLTKQTRIRLTSDLLNTFIFRA